MSSSSHEAWQRLEIGGGRVKSRSHNALHLEIPAHLQEYADAQIDDHHALPRRDFPCRPPQHLALRARASHAHPIGTLGFGFWNDPFALSLGQAGAARRLPCSPQAVWYFYVSPPSQLAFHPTLPGYGWKAMVITSPNIPSLLLAPGALLAAALAQIPGIRRPVMHAALRTFRCDEALLEIPLDQWHRYDLDWDETGARFEVDGVLVLQSAIPVHGPLGFVAWIDNQYAIASPRDGLRFGVLPTEDPQWLEISHPSITSRASG
jgi:hypothetical protein